MRFSLVRTISQRSRKKLQEFGAPVSRDGVKGRCWDCKKLRAIKMTSRTTQGGISLGSGSSERHPVLVDQESYP